MHVTWKQPELCGEFTTAGVQQQLPGPPTTVRVFYQAVWEGRPPASSFVPGRARGVVFVSFVCGSHLGGE